MKLNVVGWAGRGEPKTKAEVEGVSRGLAIELDGKTDAGKPPGTWTSIVGT